MNPSAGWSEAKLKKVTINATAIIFGTTKVILDGYARQCFEDCTYCGRCAFLDGQECRFPEEAVPSVESYGIDVMALEKSGMPYYNGKNTVSCVSLILLRM